jgi:hypothetical protein
MAESLWVVVTDPIRPGDAPDASTIAERLVFPMLYSTQPATCDSAAGVSLPAIEPPAATAAVWRAMTGRYTVSRMTDTSLDLVPRTQHGGPIVHVSIIEARLGRDALDAGADVLITSDAITLAYAVAKASLSSVPLPWDRLYVLMEPGRLAHMPGDSAPAAKMDLAANALRVEAQPASDSVWWRGLKCPNAESGRPIQAPGGTLKSPTARIVYDKRDDVARALSERLVGLADARAARLAALDSALSSARSIHATGLDSGAFRAALASGREVAYVTALPINPTNRCHELDIIHDLAPWLATADDTLARGGGEEQKIVPLVETRARAILRRQRVGVSIDRSGIMYLELGPAPRPQS